MSKSLDLGCGKSPKNPFNADEVFGIDIREDVDRKIYHADLVIEPIPFADNFLTMSLLMILSNIFRAFYIVHIEHIHLFI